MMKISGHDRLNRLTVLDGRLRIAGRHADELLAMAGGGPCYVYDREAIAARVAAWRAVMPGALKLHYAIKANPLPAVVCCLAGQVDGLDVASLGELQLALSSGASPCDISFAGPAKTEPELRAAVAAGVTVNVESERELARIARIADAAGVRARVALRVNPDFALKSSGMKMGGGPQPFGIDAECVPALLARCDAECLAFAGFHIYCGSQNLSAEALIEAHNQTFELARSLAEAAQLPVLEVNIGGGLGIPYFPGERELPLGPVADNLDRLIAGRAAALQDTRFVMELGRYLVGEAGYYLCRVVDIKVSRGRKYLLTDGGLHQHLSNSGNFGQVLRKNYPVVLADKLAAQKLETVDICGPLCTPLDILAAGMSLPTAEIGDPVVVLQSGAYGASASPQAFLGHPPPCELLL